MSNTHVVAYGSLKRGFGNHRLLESSELVHEEVSFTGTMADLGGIPCVTQHGNTTLKGEMYSVDEETLARLDRLEGHPSFYERKRVHTSGGEAWIYLIDEPHYYEDGRRIVKSGNWGQEEAA